MVSTCQPGISAGLLLVYLLGSEFDGHSGSLVKAATSCFCLQLGRGSDRHGMKTWGSGFYIAKEYNIIQCIHFLLAGVCFFPIFFQDEDFPELFCGTSGIF
jgi:hypothetical protein